MIGCGRAGFIFFPTFHVDVYYVHCERENGCLGWGKRAIIKITVTVKSIMKAARFIMLLLLQKFLLLFTGERYIFKARDVSGLQIMNATQVNDLSDFPPKYSDVVLSLFQG